MAPVHDPRYSKTRFNDARRAEQQAAQDTAKWEYLKPLALLAAALPIGAVLATRGPAGADAAVTWLAMLGLSIGLGMVALIMAVKLFLGGAGPLGLATLRIAGALAAADAVYLLVAGGLTPSAVSLVTASLVFVGLAVWLFDMAVDEAALLAIIILVLHILLAVALFAWSPSSWS